MNHILTGRLERIPAIQKRQPHECGCRAYREIFTATYEQRVSFLSVSVVYAITHQMIKASDFCKFTDKMGTIEETGLRTTKIRTLEHTVVTVPNAEFAAMQIENLTERERCRFSPSIRLHYRTSPEQIRDILYKGTSIN